MNIKYRVLGRSIHTVSIINYLLFLFIWILASLLSYFIQNCLQRQIQANHVYGKLLCVDIDFLLKTRMSFFFHEICNPSLPNQLIFTFCEVMCYVVHSIFRFLVLSSWRVSFVFRLSFIFKVSIFKSTSKW